MITATFNFDSFQLDDDALARMLYTASENVTRFFDSRELVADALMPTPPRRNYPGDYPLEWTSERQRRAYFATNGFGAGIPYQRTGGLRKSWHMSTIRTGEGAVMVIENTAPSAKYVLGTFSGVKPQQRFHNITGWQPIADKWQSFAQRIASSVQQELQVLTRDVVIIR